MTFRLLITGSRSWTDLEPVATLLRHYANPPSEMTVVHGAATSGADMLVARWLARHPQSALRADPHPARWNAPCVEQCRPGHRRVRSDGSDYCPFAGPRRNQHMVDLGADVCVAFMRGESSGTRDCMRRARAAGVHTEVVRWQERYDLPLRLGELPTPTTPVPQLIKLSPEQLREAVQKRLNELGLTYDELAEQAKLGNFASTEARKLWYAIGGVPFR